MNRSSTAASTIRKAILLAVAFGIHQPVLRTASAQTEQIENSHAAERELKSSKFGVIEFRLGFDEPGEGRTEFEAPAPQKKLYLSSEVIIKSSDIEKATIVNERSRPRISIRLKAEPGKRLEKVSSENVDRALAVLFQGKIIAAPILKSPVGREAVIDGNFTQSEAEEIASALRPNPPSTIRPNERFNEPALEAFAQSIDELDEQRMFSGTIVIAENGEIVFEKSVGYSDIANAKRFIKSGSADGCSFRLASVSKQFTAMGIMLLKEQGKLDFDDPITKFLPELPYKNVTIRNLLHHTSGLEDYMTMFGRHWNRDVPVSDRNPVFNADLIKLYSDLKPELRFTPGTKHVYSNTGYAMLGSIIVKASGQELPEFFESNLFGPLGMSESHVYSPDSSFAPANRVYGFRYPMDSNGFFSHDWHYLNGMVGDGGIYASAHDLLKWDEALYTEKLVSKETLDEAFTSGKLKDGSEFQYGFGWQIGKSPTSGPMIHHSGRWVGFGTFIGREPELHVTVIILSNNSISNMGPIFNGLAKLRSDSKNDDSKCP